MEEESGDEDIDESSVSKNMDKEVAGNLMCQGQGDDIYDEDSDTEEDKKYEHGVKVLTDRNPGPSTIQRLINNSSATECLFTNNEGDVIVYDLANKSDVKLLFKLLSKPLILQGCHWELWNRTPEAKTKGKSFASCFQPDSSEDDEDSDDDGDACKNEGYDSNDDDDDDDIDVNSDDNCSDDNDKKVSAKSKSTGKRNPFVDDDVSVDSEEEDVYDLSDEDSESIESGKKSSKQSSKNKKKPAGKGKNKNDYCSY